MLVFLETERLLLRQFTLDDVDNLYNLDSDPEVMRFVGGTPTSREAVENHYLPAYLGYYERGDRYGFWAAVERSTGDFLGWFHLRPEERSRADEAELGYRLRAAAWGKGYATEGSRALIYKAFTELGVQRVLASTAINNFASRRVLEKAGLTFVRQFYHMSPAGDAVEYVLEKEHWRRQEKAKI